MRTSKFALLVLAACCALGASASNAKTLTIGIDLSTSNPLVVSPEFARVAAGVVKQRIAALAPGDIVIVRTFGERSLANIASERVRITRRARAEKVAARIAGFVASIPSTKSDGQGSTAIAAFFEFGSFDCANGGDVLVLTDGIESSDAIDARRFLGGKPLPAPEKGLLAGCSVTMFGVGQSAFAPLSRKEVKTIRTAWAAWMKTAGAQFAAVIDP